MVGILQTGFTSSLAERLDLARVVGEEDGTWDLPSPKSEFTDSCSWSSGKPRETEPDNADNTDKALAARSSSFFSFRFPSFLLQ